MADKAVAALKGFVLDKVLSEDPKTRNAALLGHFPAETNTGHGADEKAIILLEKTHFEESFYRTIGDLSENCTSASEDLAKDPKQAPSRLEESASSDPADSTHPQSQGAFSRLELLNQNDVYSWMLGWTPTTENSPPGVKISVIRPATDAHIAKHSSQALYMVDETPSTYREKIEPWIASQPLNRIQWVYNILDKKKEAESIVFEDLDPETGFIILPDLKWDQKTLSSLHLTAIVKDRSLRSIRDLRPASEKPSHTDLLRKVRTAAAQVARERYGLSSNERGGDALRCFFHYHPTYYHMHIHITAANNVLQPGALVGKAHQLEEMIDLLELGVDFKERTLRYQLGERSELWDVLSFAQTSSA